MNKRMLSGLAVSMVALIQHGAAFAQSDAAGDAVSSEGVGDIIVTAQRRSERLQDVPIAITAVSAERLSNTGAAGASDLAILTPSLNVPVTQGYFQPRIRGVGTLAFGPGIENPIATYIDGVYLAAANSSLLNFSDVQRVEVLKGPQGTLFGRNATGGLIQIVTRDPKEGLYGSADVTYGNYEQIGVNAMLSGGSDQVRGSVAGFYKYQGEGYGTNLATGRTTNRPLRNYGVRGKLLFTPGDTTKITLAGDYAFSEGSYPDLSGPQGLPGLFGSPLPGSVYNTNSDYQASHRASGGGGSLHVEQELGDLKLVSITAYRESRTDYRIDYDGSPNPFLKITNTQKDSQFSQELQLASGSGSPISWIVGAYFFDFKGSMDPSKVEFAGPTVGTPPVTQTQITGDQKGTSWAGFGQVTVPLGDRTKLTGGIRYTTEKRTIDSVEEVTIQGAAAPVQTVGADESRFNKVTFRAAIDHKLADDVLVYASFNRGFKSGGFNLLTPNDPGYEPETLDAYETGVKVEAFDRKLRINTAFFYYDYTNIQLPFFTDTGLVGIANGPSAKLYGADVDFEFVPMPQLHIFGGASYIHNRFGSYPDAVANIAQADGTILTTTEDATGNSLPFTSKFSGNIGLEYRIDVGNGDLAFNVNYYYNDGYALEVDNRNKQDAYELVSGSIGWTSQDERLSLKVWGKNLTNSIVYNQFSSGSTGYGASYQPPRTYGVTLGTKF